VEIKDSYRNMLEKIKPHFHLIETARKAVRMAGLEPVEVPVRGGTDGATLSWNGLPCPNLGTGGFNFHGVCECTTVERMDRCTEIVLTTSLCTQNNFSFVFCKALLHKSMTPRENAGSCCIVPQKRIKHKNPPGSGFLCIEGWESI